MKTINYILLCTLPFVFSCMDLNPTEPGEPDKTIENVTGTLHYFDEAKMWGIYYYYPGTIDSVDTYLIKETDKDFNFEEGKKVTVSGACYRVEEPPFPLTGGQTVYYIIVTKLTYE